MTLPMTGAHTVTVIGSAPPPLWLLGVLLVVVLALVAFPRWFIAHMTVLPPLSWWDFDPEDPPELLVWGARLWGGVCSALVVRIMMFGHP